ncbi:MULTISPECIES: hypothetical protein [unclassified Paraflavitalea]|uniref:hypothetical protein n=1 Tax=unclassified Paraflavitalea TaxID=2798305 RepID=UPI003D337134
MSQKKDFDAIGAIGGFTLICIIGILFFLFTEGSPLGDFPAITGIEAIKLQGTSFWIWVFILNPLAFVALYLAIKNEDGGGKLGKKLSGSRSLTSFLIALFLALLVIPWIKVYDTKANAGVDASKFKKVQLK